MLPADYGPLQIHFALKQRGSSFSDIARRATRGARRVTPQNVRGVVYGYVTKNAAAIKEEISKVLTDLPQRDLPRLAA